VVLNAANELAVAAFLAGGSASSRSHTLIERALAHVPARALVDIDTCVDVDAETRRR
jgi:1-deoxy-D-xylulose 5-phosphate reductoisomerase